MEQMSSALVLEAKKGSDEALERLFSMCGERLLAAIRLRLGRSLRCRLESRDILQATLMKAFSNIGRLEAETSVSLMAWLVKIAENEIRDQAAFHGRGRRSSGVELDIEHVPAIALAERVRSQSSQLVFSQESARIEQAIESLSDDHREVILLRYFNELSFKEIGERLGRSPDACRTLLARAMAVLTVMVREGGS